MKWNETIASSCRYGHIAEDIWGNWEILWEDSEADYQGHASILGKKRNKYVWYEWWYGSCSGCDGWEAASLTNEQIKKEMNDTAVWFDSKRELKTWLEMLEGKAPLSNYDMDRGGGLTAGLDILSGGLLERVNAIRKELGMEVINNEPKKEKENE